MCTIIYDIVWIFVGSGQPKPAGASWMDPWSTIAAVVLQTFNITTYERFTRQDNHTHNKCYAKENQTVQPNVHARAGIKIPRS